MKRIFIGVLALINLATLAQAQKHDYYWLMGYNSWNGPQSGFGGTSINFAHEPPSITQEDRDMNIDVTMASFCDSLGNLICYTNGIYIANADHELMENGDSLNPGQIANAHSEIGYSIVFGAFFLQDFGNPNLIHLLHLKIDYHPDLVLSVCTLYKTTIDLSLNGGLGAVISKNEVILNTTTGTFSAINATKHANGRDWWIILSDGLENKFYVFLLSPFGLEEPDEFTLSPPVNDYTNGAVVFSPDGNKMVRFDLSINKIFVYDFDRCTGTISEPVVITPWIFELGGGASISQNSRFLYVTSSTKIYQYDLFAQNIGNTETIVAVYDGFQSPFGSTFFMSQLGPDGRIYLNCTNGENVLHVINQPNFKGDSCKVAQHGVQLPTYNAFTSPHFPNYRLGPLDGSPCDTLGLDNHPLAGWRHEVDTANTLLVSFTDNSYYEPETWAWDFGDGNSSSAVNPTHHYAAPGEYEVCLTVSNQYDSDTLCKIVTVVGVASTGDVAAGISLQLFPNPASHQVRLSYALPPGKEAQWRLLDSLGREVLRLDLPPGSGSRLLGLEGVPPGLYFYEMNTQDSVVRTGKLLVLR